MQWKIDKKFLVFQIIAFQLVMVIVRITTRILVVGSERVNTNFFTILKLLQIAKPRQINWRIERTKTYG